jgi:urease accessory protein
MFNLLPLIQLIDSAFPTGIFSHSFGLETAILENRITNAKQLSEWLESYIIGSLVPIDGAAVFWAHHFVTQWMIDHCEKERSRENLRLLDHRLTLSRLARESREGGIKIGRRYLHIIQELYPDCGLKEYHDWILRGECYGNASIVHGWICVHLDQSQQIAVLSYLYSGINGLIQNAIRAMSIGQTGGQKVLKNLLHVICQETIHLVHDPPEPDQLFNQNIAQEICAMRHETLYSRLFMS